MVIIGFIDRETFTGDEFVMSRYLLLTAGEKRDASFVLYFTVFHILLIVRY